MIARKKALVGAAIFAAAGFAGWIFLRTMSPRADASRHLLIITLDTTRADYIGCYGYRPGGESPTPNIDALAADGGFVSNAFCSAPITLPSHTTFFTGLEPPAHGVRDNSGFVLPPRSARRFATLAEILSDAGFTTAAFVSSQPVAAATGLSAGFATYDDVGATGQGGQITFNERSAEATTDRALAWIAKETPSRSFVWIHYFDPHHPHVAHDGAAGKIAATAKSLYAGEIAFMDQHLGRVIEAYKKAGLYDQTTIIVVGDHGEGLGDHDEESHGYLLFDATVRVPLIVKPEKGAERVLCDMAAGVDVFPTALERTTEKIPAGLPGRSVFATAEKRSTAFAETIYPWRQYDWAMVRAWRDGSWKMIHWGPKRSLFDLGADPGEKNDLITRHADRADAMERAMRAYLAEFGEPLAGDTRTRVSSAIDALSYTGGAGRDVDVEPPAEKQRSLAAVIDRMGVVRDLDLLRNRLARVEEALSGGDNSLATRELDGVRDAVSGLDAVDPGCPAVLFWTGRALHRLAASPAGFSPKLQNEILTDALERFERYGARRPHDATGFNQTLAVLFDLWKVGADRRTLDDLIGRVSSRAARGEADGLSFAWKGRAHESLKDLAAAEASFAEAVKRSPERAIFARELERIRAARSDH